VLADAYVRSEYFPRADPAHLQRGVRTSAIIEAIGELGDVVCLQEAEPALVEAIAAARGGWTVRYAQKRGKPDGVAIVARPGVALTDVDTIVYADGTGHVALVATIRVGARDVRLATTHVRWARPDAPPAERFGLREIGELVAALRAPAPPALEAIERVDAARPRLHAIACGDFNFEPHDDAHALLVAAGFVDAHARPTANPNGRAKRIDYIACTRELAFRAIEDHAIDDATPLPSATMPSDHVPIAIEL
jgi:endonuclease/exonuclease/phosphatase family metal-dependent hydrolase